MAWVRDGEPPDQIKVSFVISAKEHPALARFVWSLPYRGASKILRDILSAAVIAAGAGKPGAVAIEAAQSKPAPMKDEQPGDATDIGKVSDAASEVIKNFDKMFPS